MNRFIKKTALFVLGVGTLAFSVQGAFAQSNDFFSNTQSADLRSSGSNGAPGFNPCAGGTATSTSCTGAPAGAKPLLDPVNLGDSTSNTAGLFEQTGPGAITDNMFGIIERPTNPIQCRGQSSGVLGGDSVGIGTGPGTLNCGDGKFDPATQGQTIPSTGANLSGAMAVNMPIDLTSCGAGNTPAACAGDPALHRTQMENAFVWNPTGSPVALPVNTANMPTIIAAPAAKTCAASTGDPTVCGQQSMIETTALGTTTTAVVSLNTDFATTNTPGGVQGPGPTVNWESHIVQSEMIGGGTFDQTLSGSFVYNANTAFLPTLYPNGQSQTIHSGATGVPVETIP